MQIDPTLQALFLVFAGAILAHFLAARSSSADKGASALARLAAIEATIAHIAMDQEAHKRQGEELQKLTTAVARIEEWTKRVDAQNQMIWAKLKVAHG